MNNGKRLVNFFGPFLCQLLGATISPNCVYDLMNIVETVLFTASQEKSIEECATRLRDMSDDKNPSPDTVLRRLGKLSKEQIFETFDGVHPI